MTGIWECILVFFAVTGLFWTLWLFFGRLLFPGPSVDEGLTALPLRGDAEGLEQAISQLLWLRSGQLLPFPIVLVDRGLSPLGRARVSRLLAREPRLLICSPEGLASLLQKDG